MPQVTRYSRRRQVERLRLGGELLGRIGSADVAVLDVSLLGCRVEHHASLRVASEVRLSIMGEEPIEMDCVVARCALDPLISRGDVTLYQSGLRFLRGHGSAPEQLRRLIARQIGDALQLQKSNAHGELPAWLRTTLDTASMSEQELQKFTSLPYLRVARARGYMTYTMDRNVWKKRRSQNPSQPEEGFTVWAYEDEEQLELLASTYAHGDEAMRSLIRLCAELSLVADDTIPPQRFLP